MLNQSIRFECAIHDVELKSDYEVPSNTIPPNPEAFDRYGVRRDCCGEPVEEISIGRVDRMPTIYRQGQHAVLEPGAPREVGSIRVSCP